MEVEGKARLDDENRKRISVKWRQHAFVESLQKLERRRNTIFQGRGKISKCLRIGDISVNIVKRLERNFYD